MLHLHEDLDRGADVLEDGDGVDSGQSFPLVFELVLLEHINLKKQLAPNITYLFIRTNLDLQI